MADYRFSASSISRGKGQSSIASAAYRSASRLIDERTGEIHDYTRKAGVTHSEVMTPSATPEWMQNRAQLWNAVEAVEKRSNSQLAREIQLSLPHELTEEQRLELVRGFVQEQFVELGMVADINIHKPDNRSDARNHHAHIMLTMRELTADGFHAKKATEKARSWNSDDLLKNWREQWAEHQNNELTRHGHKTRVDHRSYEAQGVDREPTQHLGPVANDMEKKGKHSRIGDENRERQHRNQLRAQMYAEQFKVQAEISRRQSKFEKWRDHKQQELQEREAATDLRGLDLSQKHDRRRDKLENELKETYGTAKATIKTELETINRKLQAKGVRKVLRDVFGKTRHDSTYREELAASLRSIEQRENEQRNKLERKINLEGKRHNERMDGLRAKASSSIERRQKQLRERAVSERSATPTTAPFVDRTKTAKADFKRANDNAPQAPNKARTEAKAKKRPPVAKKSPDTPQRESLPPPKPSKRLSLDERKRDAVEQRDSAKEIERKPKDRRRNEPS